MARVLEAAYITGDEGGAWRDRMTELREAFRLALERVAEEGRLAPGWTADTAADWAWAKAQTGTWAHLVGMRGWNPGYYPSAPSARCWPNSSQPAVGSRAGKRSERRDDAALSFVAGE